MNHPERQPMRIHHPSRLLPLPVLSCLAGLFACAAEVSEEKADAI